MAKTKKASKTALVPMDLSVIEEKAVALSATIHSPTRRRHVDPDEVEVDADKEMLHLSKDIFDSERYQAIKRLDGGYRRFVRRRSLPSMFKDGIYLVPVDLVEEIDATTDEYRKQRAKAVEAFIEEYPLLVKQSKTRLRKLYDPSDYPPADRLERAFRVTTSYLTLSVPGTLKSISSALFKKERERWEKQWTETLNTIRQALRVAMTQLVGKMTARLSEGGIIKDAGIARAQEWLDLFEKRNLTNDAELAGLVSKAKALMKGAPADVLRDDDALRAKMLNGFQALEKHLSTMVVAKPTRRVVLRDEEE